MGMFTRAPARMNNLAAVCGVVSFICLIGNNDNEHLPIHTFFTTLPTRRGLDGRRRWVNTPLSQQNNSLHDYFDMMYS